MTIETTHRKDLRRLVEELPADELVAARRYLEYLRDLGDPLPRRLEEAPEDDEEETDTERASVEEARLALRRGDVVSDEELGQKLGI